MKLLLAEDEKELSNALCVLFKHNNYDPQMIGQDISALANSATLYEKSCSYMIWGIDDKTHQVVGTDIIFKTLKKEIRN